MQSAAFKNALDIRMRLEFLKALMRVETRIEIIQPNDEPDRDPATGHVVDETSAELFIAQRPSHSVNDSAAGAGLFRHVPYFFHTDREDLRIAVPVQVELPDQMFRQRSARAFGQYRDFCANVGPGFEVGLRFSGLVNAFVARSHTNDRIVFDQEFGARKSGKDVDTALLNLFAEPPHEFVQRNNVIAMVLKGW